MTVVKVNSNSSMNLCDWVFPDYLAGSGRRKNKGLHVQVIWPGSAAHPTAGPATGPGVHQS